MIRPLRKTAFFAACMAACLAGPSSAEEPVAKTPVISIELSSAEESNAACKLSFVVQNGLTSDIDQAVYETVLFDAKGQVSQLTLLDFQDLPAGRLRVRQFQFPTRCGDISRVLINGAATCTGAGLTQGGCAQNLHLLSRTKMELAG